MCLAVPGLVQSVKGADADPMKRTGKVSFGGLVRDVNFAFVPDAKPGDYVIVHVGMALNKIDPGEARKIIEDIKLVEELMREELGPGKREGPGG
jgi:hydrogenase expression/formation protein HypC